MKFINHIEIFHYISTRIKSILFHNIELTNIKILINFKLNKLIIKIYYNYNNHSYIFINFYEVYFKKKFDINIIIDNIINDFDNEINNK